MCGGMRKHGACKQATTSQSELPGGLSRVRLSPTQHLPLRRSVREAWIPQLTPGGSVCDLSTPPFLVCPTSILQTNGLSSGNDRSHSGFPASSWKEGKQGCHQLASTHDPGHSHRQKLKVLGSKHLSLLRLTFTPRQLLFLLPRKAAWETPCGALGRALGEERPRGPCGPTTRSHAPSAMSLNPPSAPLVSHIQNRQFGVGDSQVSLQLSDSLNYCYSGDIMDRHCHYTFSLARLSHERLFQNRGLQTIAHGPYLTCNLFMYNPQVENGLYIFLKNWK